jgi:hypothetical protein
MDLVEIGKVHGDWIDWLRIEIIGVFLGMR